MDVQFIMDFIQQQGFAIFVATYVLVKNDQTIKKNTEAIISLTSLVSKSKEDNKSNKEG